MIKTRGKRSKREKNFDIERLALAIYLTRTTNIDALLDSVKEGILDKVVVR